MALYSKKLHVQKAGVVTDINLYTTLSETGNSALAIKDGEATVYAKLGAATDALASPLRVRKNGEIYAVLKSAIKPGVAPLFAFKLSYSNYMSGYAGVIYGDRTESPTTFTSSVKVTGLNGDGAVFSFLQGDKSRLMLRQYNYTPYPPPNKIIDPVASSWIPSLIDANWNSVSNLHTVTTKGNLLYATGYDLGKIAVVNMNSGYAQMTHNYRFPTAWPEIFLPTGAECHGEGLTVVGDYLYALFSVNPNGGYSVYSDSIVTKFYINRITGALTYISHLEVGKNAFTLEPHNGKLYVCALGGMQNAGSSNPETCLDIIDLATFTRTTVSKAYGMNGDIRSITIADDNHAYIFMGNYDNHYGKMIGSVYYTSIANITAPASWSKVTDINNYGYLWGVYNDSSHLWLARGIFIDIFETLPIAAAGPIKTFSFNFNLNLNSVTPVLQYKLRDKNTSGH